MPQGWDFGALGGWRQLQIQYLMVDSPYLKDTKSGASAIAGNREFHVMTQTAWGKKFFL